MVSVWFWLVIFGVEFMDTGGVDTEGHWHSHEMEHSTYEKDMKSARIEIEKRECDAHETHIREGQERKYNSTINHRQASRIPVLTPL